MSIQRVPAAANFAQISNNALRDKRLSFRARGLLAFVLSHVGEWQATRDWLVEQTGLEGRDAVQKALNELTRHGYRSVGKETDPATGKISTIVWWYHDPEMNPHYSEATDRLKNRPPVLPTVGKPVGLTEHHSKEHHLQNTNKNIPSPDAEPVEPAALAQPATPVERDRAEVSGFDDFWSTYPRRVGKRQAAKAWARAVKRADPADIIAAAGVFADDPNLPELQFVPYPATWLNRDGWEDEPLPARNGQKPPSSAERMLTLATTLAAGEMPPEVAASARNHPAYRNRHPAPTPDPFLQIVGGP